MSAQLRRVFLDTNIYILGAANAASPAGRVLRWLGYGSQAPGNIEIIVSEALFHEIRRVAKRLQNKDWAGLILSHLWHDFQIHHVDLNQDEIEQLAATGLLPKEDVAVYLTAKHGAADCFVSANRGLIRAAVQHTRDFECLTPDEFIAKYMQSSSQ